MKLKEKVTIIGISTVMAVIFSGVIYIFAYIPFSNSSFLGGGASGKYLVSGISTVAQFGDKRFEILNGYTSTNAKPEDTKVNVLFDKKNQVTIDTNVKNFYNHKPYVYSMGANGYTILNYETGVITQKKDLKDMPKSTQNMFFILIMNDWGAVPKTGQEIVKTFNENMTLFENSVRIIRKLDKYIGSISITSNEMSEKMPLYLGLYTGGVNDSEYVVRPLHSYVIEQLYDITGIQDISIQGSDIPAFDNGIDFAFDGAGAPGYYYTGIIWTKNGKPTGWQGEHFSLKKDGKGWIWKSADGDNKYYTEKVVGNFYLYEMWF